MCDVVKPLDDLLLAFYYSLTMYSIGIILTVTIGRIYQPIVIICGLIILTPLTLLFTDIENNYVEIFYGLICPLFNGIVGLLHGYNFKNTFSLNKIRLGGGDDEKLGEILKNKEKESQSDIWCCCIK